MLVSVDGNVSGSVLRTVGTKQGKKETNRCLFERFPEGLFRLARHSGYDRRGRDGDEGEGEFAGNGACEHGLPAAGGADEQDAPRRADPRVEVDFGVHEGQGDEFEHLFDAGVDASEVGEARGRRGIVLGGAACSASSCARP